MYDTITSPFGPLLIAPISLVTYYGVSIVAFSNGSDADRYVSRMVEDGKDREGFHIESLSLHTHHY